MQAHDDRNLARQLTPAEKKEKKTRKLLGAAAEGEACPVSVYRVGSLASAQNRFKVRVNAEVRPSAEPVLNVEGGYWPTRSGSSGGRSGPRGAVVHGSLAGVQNRDQGTQFCVIARLAACHIQLDLIPLIFLATHSWACDEGRSTNVQQHTCRSAGAYLLPCIAMACCVCEIAAKLLWCTAGAAPDGHRGCNGRPVPCGGGGRRQGAEEVRQAAAPPH